MFFKKNKKKSLSPQDDLNSRLVTANRVLMHQMEEQQQRDLEETLERRRKQGRILRELMGEDL